MSLTDEATQKLIQSSKNEIITVEQQQKAAQAYSIKATAASVATQVWASALNLVAGYLIGRALNGVVTVIDNYIHKVEKAKSAMSEATSAYDSSKTELESINGELKEQSTQLDVLLAKDKLTYVEEGELAKLKEATHELEVQASLKEKEVARNEHEAANRAIESYHTQFDGRDFSSTTAIDDYYKQYSSSSGISANLVSQNTDIAAQLAGYQRLIELREEAYKAGDMEEWDDLNQRLQDLDGVIWEEVGDLQDLQSALNAVSYDNLSDEGKETLEKVQKMISTIWQSLEPTEWNQMQFNDLMNEKAVSDVKDELIDLATSGKLSLDTLIKQYPDVVKALSEVDAVSEEGITNTDLFIDYLVDLAEEAENVASAADEITFFSNTDYISQFKDVSDTLSSVSELYTNFQSNGADAFSIDGLSSVISSFEEVEGMSQHVSDFMDVLSDSGSTAEDVQTAFDNLVDSYLDSTPILENVTDDTVERVTAMLEEIGVTNAAAVAQEALLKTKAQEAAATLDVNNVTYEEIVALGDEAGIADEARQSFYGYVMQKLLDEAIDTSGDIQQLANVINALGLGTAAWSRYYAARARMAEIEADPDYVSYDEDGSLVTKAQVLEQYTQMASDNLNQFKSDVQDLMTQSAPSANYGGAKSAGASSGSGSSGSGSGSDGDADKQTWDLLERQLNFLAEKRDELISQGSSSYLAYLGLSEDEINRASEIIGSSNAASASSMEELAAMAEKAGLSVGDFLALMEDDSYDSRQSALYAAIEVDKQRLPLAAQAVEEYAAAYEEAVAKVSDAERDEIEHGGTDIAKTLTGEDATEYQEAMDAFDAYTEKKQQYKDYQDELYEDTKAYYENEAEYLDGELTALENQNSLIQGRISYLEAAGQLVSGTTYETIIANLEQQERIYQQKLDNAQAELEALMQMDNFSEDSEDYQTLIAQMQSYQEAVIKTNTELKETEYELATLPIERMQTVVDLLNDAITNIKSYGSQVTASGKKLDSDYYQTLIDNGLEVIEQLKDQADLIQDVMDEMDYATGSDKWNELYDQLQDVNSEIGSMVENLYEWNAALLEMPLESIEEAVTQLELLRDSLNDLQSDYDTVITAVTDEIEQYKKRLEEQEEAETEALQETLDLLEEKRDALESENELLSLQIAYEQALANASQIASQKTVRVK